SGRGAERSEAERVWEARIAEPSPSAPLRCAATSPGGRGVEAAGAPDASPSGRGAERSEAERVWEVTRPEPSPSAPLRCASTSPGGRGVETAGAPDASPSGRGAERSEAERVDAHSDEATKRRSDEGAADGADSRDANASPSGR